MERQELIQEIQELIENHGSLHCYEGVIGNCMPSRPAHLNLNKISKVVDGVFYDDGVKKGFIQGFHRNYLTVVRYRNADPFDSFSIDYQMLSIKYLTECLNFLRRK
jgi:hypothetical protein